ncbi:hypothetical protein LguiA_034605 [Lonicera macranthoides]
MPEPRQPHLNGAYYVPSIPPPSKAYYHPSRGGFGCCCLGSLFSCCGCIFNLIFQIILTVVIFLGILALIFYLFFHPNNVKFHVINASLTQFRLENNSLAYTMSANLSIRNPNKCIEIYYDRIEARGYYQGQHFNSVELGRFYQGHKKTNNLTVEFQGQNWVMLGENQLSKYNSERTDGRFSIDMKLYLRIRLKRWAQKGLSRRVTGGGTEIMLSNN